MQSICRAKSRFPCFYSPILPDIAVLHFDPVTTRRDLYITLLVPIVLLCISSFMMFLCSRTVTVTDDAHLKLKYCSGGEQQDNIVTDDDTADTRAMAL